MRKTSVRKFIHALVDLLPLFIIPIFAININQKSVEPISIEVQEKVSVDYNQQIDLTSLRDSNFNYESVNGNYVLTKLTTTTVTDNLIFGCQNGHIVKGHKYYLPNTANDYRIRIWGTNRAIGDFNQNIQIVTANYDINGLIQFYLIGKNFAVNEQCTITPVLIDLSQMFGVGKEPTVSEFNTLITSYDYNYTVSKKILVDKPTTTTYDDTDIGSQFLYSLYKPVNDYFNFNNLFNMNDVWNWIQLNLFQGTAPLPVFIIWNIIIYEFFVDLIFLLYGVFMFIIDFAENCLEKPFDKVRRL